MPTAIRTIVVTGKKDLMNKLRVNIQEYNLGNHATRATIIALANSALSKGYITHPAHRKLMTTFGK